MCNVGGRNDDVFDREAGAFELVAEPVCWEEVGNYAIPVVPTFAAAIVLRVSTNSLRANLLATVAKATSAIDWQVWERLIRERGIEIDRRKGSDHPRYPGWVYPLDYGFVPGTVGGDGKEVDVFCGGVENGLSAALIVRHDGHEEIKLLWNASDDDVRAAHDFLADDMPVTVVRRS